MIVEKCRSCDASVVWARNTKTGKPAPLDAEPDNKGNCVLAGSSYKVVGKVEERQALVLAGVELRTNHFQTCPQAKDWKR